MSIFIKIDNQKTVLIIALNSTSLKPFYLKNGIIYIIFSENKKRALLVPVLI